MSQEIAGPDFEQQRLRMVGVQLARRGIRDTSLLDAMRRVPREHFVEPAMREFAYEDAPLRIPEGQTISQPFIVARMIEIAEVAPGASLLEVGAGSGYAAAVLAAIAAHVCAIERLAFLADLANERLASLGIVNVDLRAGDGSLGWPEERRFDAILVSAGGPSVPPRLKTQLKPGGVLVMPVGEAGSQRLLRVRRTGEDAFAEDELEPVAFVPLIGAEAWDEDRTPRAEGSRPADQREQSLPELVAAAAEPLPDFDDPGFGMLFDRWADRRVVLLGEASHGTAAFYRARAAITRRLIERHSFTIVAVEADWPDAAALDRHVRLRPGPRPSEPPFQRFPTWMWRNTDVAAILRWMRQHNEGMEDIDRRAGFYGLDLYNMHGSIAAVLRYLDQVDPDGAKVARERYGCLTPWRKDPATYGRAALRSGFAECEEAVVEQCRALLRHRLDYAGDDGDGFLDAAQNARLVASAERYYRIMYYGGAQSWNLRDTHMFDTLEHLLDAKGPASKAVVWAHNSHVGDARHTDMGLARDELSIGQLCRERFGDDAALIGFGTNAGTVAAASDWGGDMKIKPVRPSLAGSVERLCHDAGPSRFLLDFAKAGNETLRRGFEEARLERFIGVIYRPETERESHYAEASLSRQFDAWVWFDETEAVTPLGPEHARPGAPDTYPFGV